MIDDNRVYVIQGRNLNLMLTLLDDLKEVALDYAELVGDYLEMVDNKFEKLIDEIKSSEIFEDLNLDEMLEGQTLEKILNKVGLTLKGRNKWQS